MIGGEGQQALKPDNQPHGSTSADDVGSTRCGAARRHSLHLPTRGPNSFRRLLLLLLPVAMRLAIQTARRFDSKIASPASAVHSRPAHRAVSPCFKRPLSLQLPNRPSQTRLSIPLCPTSFGRRACFIRTLITAHMLATFWTSGDHQFRPSSRSCSLGLECNKSLSCAKGNRPLHPSPAITSTSQTPLQIPLHPGTGRSNNLQTKTE